MSTFKDGVVCGPKVDWQLPEVSVGKHAMRRMMLHGDTVAEVYPLLDWLELSCYELARRTACVAAQLADLGVGQGDVVAIGAQTTPWFTPLAIGAMLRGAIPAPFVPSIDASELQVVLRTSLNPRLVIAEEPALSRARTQCPELPVVPMADVDRWFERDTTPEGALQSLSPADQEGWLDSCAAILLTSGTAGPPKGVILTHRNILSVFAMWRTIWSNTNKAPGSAVMSLTPLSWVSGFMCHVQGIDWPSKTFFLAQFSEEKIAEVLLRENLRNISIHPFALMSLAKNPASPLRKALHRLNVIIVGGAPLDATAQVFAQEQLGIDVRQWYGMTECLPVMSSFLSPTPTGSSGKLLINMEAKIVDPDSDSGKPLDPHQEGELCFRSPMTTPGYWKNPEATAASIDKDGWFHTGDVAYYDEEGNFFITNRIKDLIKFRGNHVSSTELEGVLMSHPFVTFAAVIGVPYATGEEHPRAYVVLKEGASVSEEELIKLVQDTLSDYKRLRGGVRFVPHLPVNPRGKVEKRVLKKMAADEMDSQSMTTAKSAQISNKLPAFNERLHAVGRLSRHEV